MYRKLFNYFIFSKILCLLKIRFQQLLLTHLNLLIDLCIKPERKLNTHLYSHSGDFYTKVITCGLGRKLNLSYKPFGFFQVIKGVDEKAIRGRGEVVSDAKRGTKRLLGVVRTNVHNISGFPQTRLVSHYFPRLD